MENGVAADGGLVRCASVTLYQWTLRYPYGAVASVMHQNFGTPRAAQRHDVMAKPERKLASVKASSMANGS